MSFICREVVFGSPEQAATVRLRREVLRLPLGLEFDPGELQAEATQHHFACFANEQLVACCVVMPLGSGACKLRQMAVAEHAQGLGFGRRLVQFAEKFSRQKGAREMELHARASVIPFYEKLGYQAEGETFLEVTLPHRAMRKSLVGEKLES